MNRELDDALAAIDMREDVERHARAFNSGLPGEGDRRAVKARIARRQRDTEARSELATRAVALVAGRWRRDVR